ncbi:MAG: hypothetical protein R3C61_15895 [Bacteroidia bacterium]
MQNVSSYDPNDKLALPVGYDTAHYIYDNTPLSYMVRFQNTGTAPARRVVIVDTLSPALDPLTIEPGGSSHAYTWRVDDQAYCGLRFNPIFPARQHHRRGRLSGIRAVSHSPEGRQFTRHKNRKPRSYLL